MEMMIHCPSCQARLNVSQQAAGKTVRCPKCKTPFRAPNDDREIVEDTVACWLEISAEEEQARKQQAMDIPETLEDLPDYIPPPELPDLTELGGTEAAEVSTSVQAPPKPEQATAKAAVKAPPAPVAKASAAAPARGAMKAVAPARAPLKTAARPLTEPSHTAAEDGAVSAEVRLRLVEVKAHGVLIAFNAQLLKRAAFRASLPMACLACAEQELEQLVARPLIWTDRLTDHSHATSHVAARYELPARSHPAPREMAAAMRPIDEMPPPYNHPVPYYVCKRCASHVQVQAHTVAHGQGTFCEATIPSPLVALQWLGNVNGICGDDYLELESHCAASGGDEAWDALPEQIRGRLAGWYQPVDGERFVLYLKDGDYPKSDAGLGGLIVTDQRLVYSKYHKHGSLLLGNDELRLLAVRHGAFDDLISVHEGVRTKLVRLRPDDTQQLAQALEQIGAAIRVEQAIE